MAHLNDWYEREQREADDDRRAAKQLDDYRFREERVMDKSKQMCLGCRDEYYNQTRKEGCWMYANAKIVTRTKVGIWQEPPYTWRPEKTFSCHSPSGSVWLKRDDSRVREEVTEDPPSADQNQD